MVKSVNNLNRFRIISASEGFQALCVCVCMHSFDDSEYLLKLKLTLTSTIVFVTAKFKFAINLWATSKLWMWNIYNQCLTVNSTIYLQISQIILNLIYLFFHFSQVDKVIRAVSHARMHRYKQRHRLGFI